MHLCGKMRAGRSEYRMCRVQNEYEVVCGESGAKNGGNGNFAGA